MNKQNRFAVLAMLAIGLCIALLYSFTIAVDRSGSVFPVLLLTTGILLGMLLTSLVDAMLKYSHRNPDMGATAMRKKQTDAEKELQRIIDERNRVWAEEEQERKKREKPQ